MTRPQPSIAATGLRKSFGDHLVLGGIDLDVAEGTIFALLGPDGAGKTTIVRILSTLISADAGVLRVAGHPDELKRLVPGGHIRLTFADPSGLESAARTLGESACEDDSLELRVPAMVRRIPALHRDPTP